MNIKGKQKLLRAAFGDRVHVALEDGCLRVTGQLDNWADVVRACYLCAEKYSKIHVVNDIRFTGGKDESVRLPACTDSTLDGQRPDVLVIGGGITGSAIFRELTRYKLDVLLMEKGSDLAAAASSRNTGEIHPGVDLRKGSLKQHYEILGNRMYEELCRQLDVPFQRVGQTSVFTDRGLRIPAELLAWKRRTFDGTQGTRVIGKKELYQREPALAPGFKFAVYDWSAGVVCPYGITIALAENGVKNGGKVSLNTACLGMDVKGGVITAVHTNRGTLYPKVVVNAAGVMAEEVAQMAGDRFFSIHPRKGTNSILDKKVGDPIRGVAADPMQKINRQAHTKGGCVATTAYGNMLVGPDAIETWEKENFATDAKSISKTFAKQRQTVPGISERDIITWFTGVRAPTFEEDFILEKGRKTKNIVHAAGIQSPGLTAAPAFAPDVARMAVEGLGGAEKKKDFDPTRKGYGRLAKLDPTERDVLIRKNPDYGVIVCRCEEISKGEILDALRAPICVPTLDGVKRRVRPGTGRCQGGFCGPLVTSIIAEFLGVPVSTVTKDGGDSIMNFGVTK